jgi:hypothetical protein
MRYYRLWLYSIITVYPQAISSFGLILITLLKFPEDLEINSKMKLIPLWYFLLNEGY